MLLLLLLLPGLLAQQCQGPTDCTTPDAPHCSRWGWCQWTSQYGETGPRGQLPEAGYCNGNSDCTPRAPFCSRQGYCTQRPGARGQGKTGSDQDRGQEEDTQLLPQEVQPKRSGQVRAQSRVGQAGGRPQQAHSGGPQERGPRGPQMRHSRGPQGSDHRKGRPRASQQGQHRGQVRPRKQEDVRPQGEVRLQAGVSLQSEERPQGHARPQAASRLDMQEEPRGRGVLKEEPRGRGLLPSATFLLSQADSGFGLRKPPAPQSPLPASRRSFQPSPPATPLPRPLLPPQPPAKEESGGPIDRQSTGHQEYDYDYKQPNGDYYDYYADFEVQKTEPKKSVDKEPRRLEAQEDGEGLIVENPSEGESQGCLYDCVYDCVSISQLEAYRDCVDFCGKTCTNKK